MNVIIFFSLLVVWTSWVASEAVRRLANQACWQQKHRQLFRVWLRMNACYAVLHSSHGKSSSGLLFMFTDPLSHGCRGSDGGREQGEQKKNGLWPTDELSLSTILSLCPLFLLLCSVSLLLRVPGMPPIFLCSNYCLSKLCQRAEIVLMRGPAVFASVIWWVSLGTYKTRHTRGYVATSEPRGRQGLFLAPSR